MSIAKEEAAAQKQSSSMEVHSAISILRLHKQQYTEQQVR
jgi:hypothetical protein